MIRLFTGLPGAGKTLHLVAELLRLKQDEPGRPVYAYGVDGLDPSLAKPLEDPRKWRDLPDGSIIVIDEVQDVWPSGSRGHSDEVRALSLHRHRGLDFLLTTQAPTLVSSWVRKLVGLHVHHVRRWGGNGCTTYTWQECIDDVGSSAKRKLAQRGYWAFSKRLFRFYHSASVHTHKRKLPRAYFVLAGCAVIALVCGVLGYRSLKAGFGQDEAVRPGGVSELASGGSGTVSEHAPVSTADWIMARTPRVEGQPWSAPIYDNREPVNIPRIYCAHTQRRGGGSRCHCYDEHIVRIKISRDLCERIAIGGSSNPLMPVGGLRDDDHQAPVGAMSTLAPPVSDASASRSRWRTGTGPQNYTPPGALY